MKFTTTSKIVIYTSGIINVIISFILCKNILWSLLNGLIVFLLVFIVFIIIEVTCGYIIGKKLAKDENVLNQKLINIYRDLASFAVYWLGLKVKVSGLEKLEKGKNYVFYSNHQGFTDIIVHELVLSDFPHGSLYKKEHDRTLIGGIAKGCGGIALDRDNDKEAVKSIIKTIKVVNSGRSFMIYPEGHRSWGTKMSDYHPGSFKVSTKVNCDTAVIAIDGAYKRTTFIPLIPTIIKYKVVEVLKHDDIKDMNTNDLSVMCHDMTQKTLEEFRKRSR